MIKLDRKNTEGCIICIWLQMHAAVLVKRRVTSHSLQAQLLLQYLCILVIQIVFGFSLSQSDESNGSHFVAKCLTVAVDPPAIFNFLYLKHHLAYAIQHHVCGNVKVTFLIEGILTR